MVYEFFYVLFAGEMKQVPQFKERLLLTVLTGIMLWASWPANGITPLVFIAFVPLLLLEHHITQSSGFSAASFFGWSYLAMLLWNLLSTWWVCNASVGGGVFAITCNALFMAVIWLLFHWVHGKTNRRFANLFLITLWIAFEYLHLHWELSWPWLTLGNVFATKPEWIQWYEWTGTLGGSVWVLLINILIAQLIIAGNQSWKKSSIMIALWLLLPITVSLIKYETYSEENNPVEVVVTQPNIDPYNEKFSGMSNEEQLIKVLQLANLEKDDSTRFILAPETAIANTIWEDEMELYPEIKLLRKYLEVNPGLVMIIGASTNKAYRPDEKPSATARKFKQQEGYYDSYNTALQIAADKPIQLFHKSKLVPGVERMPYPGVFGFLEHLSIDMGGTAGSLGVQPEPSVFATADSIITAPVICYESVYGDYLAEYIRKGAEWIAVITNDGWWGDTPGYRQHFQYARLHAVELRRSIARSANTGQSGFINQRGDVFQKTPYWKEAVIKQTLNRNKKLTFYAQYGDYIGLIASFVLIPLVLIIFINRKKQ